MARGLIFGYVVDLKLALNSYFVNVGIGPNRDAQDPIKGSKKIVWLWFLFDFSPSVAQLLEFADIPCFDNKLLFEKFK